MLPRDPLGVTPVLRPGAAIPLEALGDPRQQAFQRALAGQVGNAMQGQVMARLADGSFVVRVADTPARMMLPAGAELGTEVPLKLVALVPRPTFEYSAGGARTLIEASPAPHPGEPAAASAAGTSGAAGTASARAAATLATNAQPLPHSATADPGASLSAAGRVLGSVLAAVMKLDQPAKAVAARAPVLGRPTLDAGALAPALRQALEKSGLFYESHVAQWAQGQRPLADLAAEPQMAMRPATPTEPEAAQLINLQLATQEQHQLAWEGQLWPGQPMQWQISRDAPRREGGAEPVEPSWQSRLRLRFPKLGELNATVVLSGGQVALRLEPGDDATAGLLRIHAPQLAAALGAAGTPLATLSIGAAAAPDE
jgi:hypothetical protein